MAIRRLTRQPATSRPHVAAAAATTTTTKREPALLVRYAPLALIALAALTFWPVCAHDFVVWDDGVNVSANPRLNPPTLAGLGAIWSHPAYEEYIPLSYTVWWLLAHAAQVGTPDASGVSLNPYVFHTANLLVHIAGALVVYVLLTALTGRRGAAWAGAALFAVHPLQVEAVAWVTGMKDVLCGLLSLLALWAYVRFAQADADAAASNTSLPPTGGARLWPWYAAATVALVLAILSKTTAISVPLLAGILDVLILRRPIRRVAPALLPWFVIAGAFVVVGWFSQPASLFPGTPLWTRPFIVAHSVAFYLYKLALPIRLGIFYDQSPPVVLRHGWLWFTWIVPVALLAIAILYRRRAPWLLAGVLLFMAAPAVVLGLVRFDFQRLSTVADRYAYVALLGPSLVLAFAIASLPERGTLRRAMPLVVGAGLALLAARSFAQTATWQDTSTLFRHALAVNPNSDVACVNVASDALDANDLAQAEALARQAIAIKPKQTAGYLVLGAVLQREGRAAEERDAFRQAVANDPSNAVALSDLATAIADQGAAANLDEAEALCRRAIAAHPGDAEPHTALAGILAAKGNPAGAIDEARSAVALRPDDARAHVKLGQLLARNGHADAAAREFNAALTLDPRSPAAREGLAGLRR